MMRVCVDITHLVQRLICIVCSPNKEHWALLIYERMPKLCFQCERIGHLKLDCLWPSIQEFHPSQITYGNWLQVNIWSSRIICSSDIKQLLHGPHLKYGPEDHNRIELESP